MRTTTDVSVVTGDTNSIVTTTTDTNASGRGESSGNGLKRNESIASSNSSGSLSDKTLLILDITNTEAIKMMTKIFLLTVSTDKHPMMVM